MWRNAREPSVLCKGSWLVRVNGMLMAANGEGVKTVMLWGYGGAVGMAVICA